MSSAGVRAGPLAVWDAAPSDPSYQFGFRCAR